jgi:hypothetical protein
MKLKKTIPVCGLLMISGSNAFVTPQSNKSSPLKTNLKQSNDDDVLFQNLFNEKNKHSLSDYTIHSEIHDYLKTEFIQYTEALAEQKKPLQDLLRKAKEYERKETISKLLTNLNNNKNVNLNDAVVSLSERNDTLLFDLDSNEKKLQKNNIFINDNFISKFMNEKQIDGDNPLLENIPIKKRIFHLFRKTKFDAQFIAQTDFLQRENQNEYPMTGGIIRGTYKNKQIYFLLTKTLDKQFRLINVSDNPDDLKTTQYLKPQ